MSTPYLSEIRIMSFGYPPRGWAQCNGQLLPINQNQALFSLLGTSYGGDGRVTFGLPNLQARVPLHAGPGYAIGQLGGEQTHTLTTIETPVHTHPVAGSTAAGGSPIPAGNFLGAAENVYAPLASATTLTAQTVGNAGGSQPHDNTQPYLALNFCMALQGIFPSRN